MSVLALCGGTAFAQSQMDAHRYAQNELGGTARYLAMGGAFGALGGDISVMNANPAGLAVYRSSEVVTTLSLTSTNAKTDWLGSTSDQTKTKVNFDNIAYVGYFPTGNDEGIVSWNVGFSYNRLKNYRRNYTMGVGGSAVSPLHTSLSPTAILRWAIGSRCWATTQATSTRITTIRSRITARLATTTSRANGNPMR